jgi:tetratricopeptide (TPR) repeat protein
MSSCAQHSSVAASTVCGGCGKSLCLQCATFEGGKDRCAACVVRYGRAKRVRTALVATGAVAVLGLGGAYAAGLVGPQGPASFDYGSKTPLVLHQRKELEREPCNRTRASEYAQTLASLQDWQGALATVDGFTAKCGSYAPLRSLSYAARMRQGEFALAVRDASELLSASPNNASYLIWRGQAHEAAKSLDAALVDFEKAFELQPAQRQVAAQLAGAYERRQRPCDALRVLVRHVKEAPASSREAPLHAQMSQLRTAGQCADAAAAQTEP